MLKKQNYLYNLLCDWIFIIGPPFFCLAIVFIFKPYFGQNIDVEPIHWIVLIMIVDVGHVYSSIYRTYLDPHMQQNHRMLLYAIPLLIWIVGIVLYQSGDLIFWRILAYMAVFHFIRQQYGFYRLYAQSEVFSKYRMYISTIAIYAATIYPVIVWHISAHRNFAWFVQNDFLTVNMEELVPIFTAFYAIIGVLYFWEEFKSFRANKFINIPKNMILLGTALSWYFAIVYFNSDLIFTFLNVVSHGIPYIALVWIYGNKKIQLHSSTLSSIQRLVFSIQGIAAFLLIIITLAFFEEMLWDSLIWHDHPSIFNFGEMWHTELSNSVKIYIIPLLAVPQVTHYILDGFIWKIKK